MKRALPRKMLKGRQDETSFYHESHQSHEWVVEGCPLVAALQLIINNSGPSEHCPTPHSSHSPLSPFSFYRFIGLATLASFVFFAVERFHYPSKIRGIGVIRGRVALYSRPSSIFHLPSLIFNLKSSSRIT